MNTKEEIKNGEPTTITYHSFIHWTNKRTMTYDVGNPGPGLG
jgi:hypothetical protein